ncbi:MAG: hypothetical protein ACRD15_14925 [Vicinamibacterales bacterium]
MPAHKPDRRKDVTAGRACPWCKGRLVLKPIPLRQLIPGDARARADEHIPESMRTRRAWVCTTPHCRFRESA